MTFTSALQVNTNTPSSQEGHSNLHKSTQCSQVLSSRTTIGEYCIHFIDEMSRKAFMKTLKSRYEVAAATLELIKKERSRTQASLIVLRHRGAQDYKNEITFRAKRESVTRYTVCLSIQT